MCVPAESVDRWLEGRDPELEKIYRAVSAHLKRQGPVHIEAVGVGILFKRKRTFVELRPRREGFMLSFVVPARIDHPRIARVMKATAHRVACCVAVRRATEVDEQLKKWLTDSYEIGGI
jgi:hypothetical protein